MHESMVAQSLLESILSESKKQNARPVIAKISCGTFNVINEDVLRFAFEAIAKGTVCEQTELIIEHKPICAKCKKCDTIFTVDLSNVKCSKCGEEDFELQPDPPLTLEEIEFSDGVP